MGDLDRRMFDMGLKFFELKSQPNGSHRLAKCDKSSLKPSIACFQGAAADEHLLDRNSDRAFSVVHSKKVDQPAVRKVDNDIAMRTTHSRQFNEMKIRNFDAESSFS